MSIKPSHILGMNARYRYTKMNPSSAKQFGFNKLRTKELLVNSNIPTAQLFHVFESLADVENINWEAIPVPFVIKPASGSAGKGIWVIKKKLKNKQVWLNQDNEQLSEADLNLHIENILDGEFSTWGHNHKALIEQMIQAHPAIGKYAYQGTPDIRVIIFNSVPVMAMARIPTKESRGTANLDKGAIGLGIDMASGISTYGITGKSGHITHFPHLKKKVNGIMIPQWRKVLETAVQAAQAAGYVFMGADMFIDKDHGPMVVELNGFPGLSIQLCNKAGLKRRLERVEGLEVRDAKHGVKISQALFAEIFPDQRRAEEGIQIIDFEPTVTVYGDNRQTQSVTAMVNTGRYRSAISQNLAEELGLIDLEDLLWRQKESIEGKVPVVEVKYRLKDHTYTTAMVVSKRLNRHKYQVELGRKDMQGFLVGETEQ